MLALQQYGSSDEEEGNKQQEDGNALHLKPLSRDNEYSLQNQIQICATPLVLPTVSTPKYITKKKQLVVINE